MTEVVDIYRADNGKEVLVLDPDEFNAVRVERSGLNALILRELEHEITRFDGKSARFELEHRWFSKEENELVCVSGNDFTYWKPSEINPDEGLFDQLYLF